MATVIVLSTHVLLVLFILFVNRVVGEVSEFVLFVYEGSVGFRCETSETFVVNVDAPGVKGGD